MIGLKDSRQFFSQWEAKPKPIAPCTRDFSRALSVLQVISRNCDWFVALSAPVLIGRSNCFGFGFSTVIWKPLYDALISKRFKLEGVMRAWAPIRPRIDWGKYITVERTTKTYRNTTDHSYNLSSSKACVFSQWRVSPHLWIPNATEFAFLSSPSGDEILASLHGHNPLANEISLKIYLWTKTLEFNRLIYELFLPALS